MKFGSLLSSTANRFGEQYYNTPFVFHVIQGLPANALPVTCKISRTMNRMRIKAGGTVLNISADAENHSGTYCCRWYYRNSRFRFSPWADASEWIFLKSVTIILTGIGCQNISSISLRIERWLTSGIDWLPVYTVIIICLSREGCAPLWILSHWKPKNILIWYSFGIALFEDQCLWYSFRANSNS